MKKHGFGIAMAILMVFAACALTLVGCKIDTRANATISSKPAANTNSTSAETALKAYDLKAAITVGNHTYLPLHLYGTAHEHVKKILRTLNTFEKAHPELEVKSWGVEERPGAMGWPPFTDGIWVNHRPKQKDSGCTK